MHQGMVGREQRQAALQPQLRHAHALQRRLQVRRQRPVGGWGGGSGGSRPRVG